MLIPPSVTERAFARLSKINQNEVSRKMLRVAVAGGGCSGFQYEISLTDVREQDDIVLEGHAQVVLVDPVSAPFLSGAVIDYEEELVGSRFRIDNPNAISSCGCGVSFAL